MAGKLWRKIGPLHRDVVLLVSETKAFPVTQEFPDHFVSYEEHLAGDILLFHLTGHREIVAEIALVKIADTVWGLTYSPAAIRGTETFEAELVSTGAEQRIAESILKAVGFTIVQEEPNGH